MDEPNATHRIDDIVNAIEETYGDGGEGRPTGRTSGPRSTTRTCRNSTTRKSSSTTPTTEPSSIAATRTSNSGSTRSTGSTKTDGRPNARNSL